MSIYDKNLLYPCCRFLYTNKTYLKFRIKTIMVALLSGTKSRPRFDCRVVYSVVRDFLPEPKRISEGSPAKGVNPNRNICSKTLGKSSKFCAETSTLGRENINIIQRKIPRTIPKKQIKLFLLRLGSIRPPKYRAVTDRRSPEKSAKRIGGRRIIASINIIGKRIRSF